jgi:hypothetical protein
VARRGDSFPQRMLYFVDNLQARALAPRARRGCVHTQQSNSDGIGRQNPLFASLCAHLRLLHARPAQAASDAKYAPHGGLYGYLASRYNRGLVRRAVEEEKRIAQATRRDALDAELRRLGGGATHKRAEARVSP